MPIVKVLLTPHFAPSIAPQLGFRSERVQFDGGYGPHQYAIHSARTGASAFCHRTQVARTFMLLFLLVHCALIIDTERVAGAFIAGAASITRMSSMDSRKRSRLACLARPLALMLIIAVMCCSAGSDVPGSSRLHSPTLSLRSAGSRERTLQAHQGDKLLPMDAAMQDAVSDLQQAATPSPTSAATSSSQTPVTTSKAQGSTAQQAQQAQAQQVPAQASNGASDNARQWPDGYVAICLIVKNQHKDIREWLQYHQWLGVGKVYMFDNNSSRPLASRIPDFLQSGFVEYQYFTGKLGDPTKFVTTKQYWAYDQCMHRFGKQHRWLALIDSDEFIVLHDTSYNNNINTFMRQYEEYGALAVNWVLMGSSGIKKHPAQGALVSYTACMPTNHEECRHVKIIANTKFLAAPSSNPHSVVFNTDKAQLVTEQFQVMPSDAPRTTSVSVKKIALYHYVLKSWEDFASKMARGSPTENRKTWEFFDLIDSQANETCSFAVQLGRQCCQQAQGTPRGADDVLGGVYRRRNQRSLATKLHWPLG